MAEIVVADIWVPGEPYGKGRPRASVVTRGDGTPVQADSGRFVVNMATPKKTRNYEHAIGLLGRCAMRGRPPLARDIPVEVHLMMTFRLPTSWSAARQRAALAGEIRPVKTPDADNVIKACFDGLIGVIWTDDTQVADGAWTRRYGTTPGVRIRVLRLPGAVVQAEIAAEPADQLPF